VAWCVASPALWAKISCSDRSSRRGTAARPSVIVGHSRSWPCRRSRQYDSSAARTAAEVDQRRSVDGCLPGPHGRADTLCAAPSAGADRILLGCNRCHSRAGLSERRNHPAGRWAEDGATVSAQLAESETPDPAAVGERRGAVAIIRLNRPAALNSVNAAPSTAVENANRLVCQESGLQWVSYHPAQQDLTIRRGCPARLADSPLFAILDEISPPRDENQQW